MPPTIVLGVDPGLTRCGLAVVAGPEHRPVLLHASCARTAAGDALERRLLAVHDAIDAVIREHAPDVVGVERVLFSANTRTAMATGQAAGVALLAAARRGLRVVSYSPNEVKQTVAGSGAAEKDAVGRLVAAQLRLSAPPRPADVADAVAVALTHLARSRAEAAVEHASTREGSSAAHRRAAESGGWEALIAGRGLSVSGGTAPSDPRPASSARSTRRGGRG